MPKAMQFTRGSIIYFEGDKGDFVFVLQKGLISLSTSDIETGIIVKEQIKEGEFFGVKSALGYFPREETATAVADSLVISMSIAEFEKVFSSNKPLVMKMLRVFSNQLRTIHRKIESVLKSTISVDQPSGMMDVAQSFYNSEQYKACCDICLKLLKRFPTARCKEEAAKLYTNAKIRAEKVSRRKTSSAAAVNQNQGGSSPGSEAALKAFSLPAFERFAKEFEAGSVIIAEYEPGDTFYFIQEGFVQLAKCVNGSKKNLDILRPGEVFGEMAILENSPRSATCLAVTSIKLLEFTKENFEVLITGNPQMALILLRLFCKRIYDQKRRFRILCMSDLPARIADVFLLFDEMNPVTNPNERARRFNLTVQDVAHWAGLPVDVARDEIDKYASKRKIDVYENYIDVGNIQDFRRIVEQRIQLRRSNLKT